MGEVLTVFPDRRGNVRNVSVLVKPKQEGFGPYKASQGHTVSRHVSKLIVLVPAEDRCENAESSDSGLVAGCSSHIDWVGVVVGGVKTSFCTSLYWIPCLQFLVTKFQCISSISDFSRQI